MIRTERDGRARRAIVATLAVALALSPATTAPARAVGAGDALVAVAVFGAVAAALLAASGQEVASPAPAPHLPPVAADKRLPVACRFDIQGGSDHGTWFARQCLVANYDRWPLLPARCERRVRYPGRRFALVAYEAGCLAQSGYRPDEPEPVPGSGAIP